LKIEELKIKPEFTSVSLPLTLEAHFLVDALMHFSISYKFRVHFQRFLFLICSMNHNEGSKKQTGKQ